jgi:RNA recognition motif-containing protein
MPSLTSAELRNVFESTLRVLPSLPPQASPLVCDVKMHICFAFVEFSSELIANEALALFDGIELLGQPLRVGRVSGFCETTTPTSA